MSKQAQARVQAIAQAQTSNKAPAQTPAQAPSQASFFNLHVEGIGYLNRVRTVTPKQGKAFLACTVAAMRGSSESVAYTYFDCVVSGTEAQKIVRQLEQDVADDKPALIGFKVGDIYPELFTFEKGDKQGQQAVSIKGRLLKIKFAKVNGVAVDLPQSVQARDEEEVAA